MYKNGVVFGGMSVGVVIMSNIMFVGGDSYGVFLYGFINIYDDMN